MMESVCVITGGSSGIGLATAQQLLRAGYTVYELSRRQTGAPGMLHIPTDITDEAAVQRAVDTIMRQHGRIDLLINNAGFGISGAIEFTQTPDAKHQFDVNFFGMVNMNRAVLPVMRKAGGGRIINLSSVAGVIAIPFQAYYSASKAAINAYTMALRNEVSPFGISVCAVMPGDIRTGFTAAREKLHEGDEAYAGRIARSVAGMERDEQQGMSAEVAGRYICSLAERKHVKPLYAIGWQYKLFCVLQKLLPVRVLSDLVGLLYAK